MRGSRARCGAGSHRSTLILGWIGAVVDWVGSRVVHRQWRWPDLARSSSKSERGKGVSKREKREEMRERKKKIFLCSSRVFETRIYSFLDFLE